MPAIFEVGAGGKKQVSQSAAGQWHIRVRDEQGHWGRWLPCEPNRRPRWAWYNPRAGKSRLPDADC